ncbi:MAG: dTDP-4-dehydrorhamnose 3,5-epimerase [Acidiferrobacter sp.]
MNIIDTAIDGVRIVESTDFQDERGAFSRLFCARELEPVLGDRHCVQINQSLTRKVGAIRGMHYQKPPQAEMKIVCCLKGRVFDVAVDLRQGSPTFLQWVSVDLSPQKRHALILPEGCAHGFQVLDANSELLYLHTAYYTPACEGAVHFSDPMVDIRWPLPPADLSNRDQNHPFLTEQFSGLLL